MSLQSEQLDPNSTRTLTPTVQQQLLPFLGVYRGQGVNHAGEAFKADFLLDCSLDEDLIEIKYRAYDDDSVFHEERTWITQDLLKQTVAAWTVSTNTQGVLTLPLIESESDPTYLLRLRFRHGNPDDLSQFREQIELGIRQDRLIEYIYSWGVPHEKFETKSRCLLSLKTGPDNC